MLVTEARQLMACNALHSIEGRLSRSILDALDRTPPRRRVAAHPGIARSDAGSAAYVGVGLHRQAAARGVDPDQSALDRGFRCRAAGTDSLRLPREPRHGQGRNLDPSRGAAVVIGMICSWAVNGPVVCERALPESCIADCLVSLTQSLVSRGYKAPAPHLTAIANSGRRDVHCGYLPNSAA